MKIRQGDGRIVAEGPLVVTDSEGGFGPDGYEIGDNDLTEIVAALFGLETDGRGSLGNRKLGRVRLILERLPDEFDGPASEGQG